ncbi:MAG: hypothetical protein WDN28_08645 [Chthoniobacter sp.]
MRTIIELPDDLFRKAKARAAMQGQTLKDLVADALTLLLQTSREAPRRRAQFPIVQPKDPNRILTPEMVTAATEQMLTEEAKPLGSALQIRSLQGHRVLTPGVSHSDLAGEMFGR